MPVEPPAPSRRLGATLLGIEERFASALVEADPDGLDELLSDDWLVISPDGRIVSKATFVAALRSGELTHSSMTSDEIRIRVFDSSAVITARVVTLGTYQGQAFRTVERSTDLFAREAGRWRCVLTQLTTISEV